MTSLKFDVMSDIFEVITPVNRDDNVVSKVSQCIFPHRTYLMMVQMIGKIKQVKSKVRHFKQTYNHGQNIWQKAQQFPFPPCPLCQCWFEGYSVCHFGQAQEHWLGGKGGRHWNGWFHSFWQDILSMIVFSVFRLRIFLETTLLRF